MRYLCALLDLDDLQPRIFETDDAKIAVVRIGAEVFAFDPSCTHKPGPLAEGAVTRKRTVLCPWHLGTFDLRTGVPVSGPPKIPLRVHDLAIQDGGVFILD